MIKFAIREGKDKSELMSLFEREGVKTEPENSAETVKCWKIYCGKNDEKLVGGAVLAKKAGLYIVNGIVMDKDFQRLRLGHELMMRVIEGSIAHECPALYIETDIAEFFSDCGFEKLSKTEIPGILDSSENVMKLEIGVMSKELKSGKGTNA